MAVTVVVAETNVVSTDPIVIKTIEIEINFFIFHFLREKQVPQGVDRASTALTNFQPSHYHYIHIRAKYNQVEILKRLQEQKPFKHFQGSPEGIKS
jgi:hypothetical protein